MTKLVKRTTGAHYGDEMEQILTTVEKRLTSGGRMLDENGKQVEVRISITDSTVQWRRPGATEWTDLF